MALEVTQVLPVLEDFTLLSQYHQQTPGSFFGGKPVLHLRCPLASIKISREDLALQPAFANFVYEETGSENSVGEEQVVIEKIDVWVSSSYLTLVSTVKAQAIRIEYPTITVHAQEGSAVLLGLNLSDTDTPDEDLVFIQLRIIPSSIETYEEPSERIEVQHTNGDNTNSTNPAQALFKAIADCQELNPDPPDGSDEEYDETAPGASGWITSENMEDFMDENGELRIPQDVTVVGAEESDEPAWPLGQGAGRARRADELDNEDDDDDGETKWQRTD